MEWSAGTCMEIAKDNKPSSGKAYMHNYKFDSKGATNKNLEKRKVIGILVLEKTILEKFCPILAMQQSRMCTQYH